MRLNFGGEMKLEQPKMGTCGECRWWNRDDDAPATSYGQCKRYPPTRWKYTCFPKTPAESWCGEWGPQEGKVCGNCAEFVGDVDHDDDIGICWPAEVRTHAKQSDRTNRDTCTAWRWVGER